MITFTVIGYIFALGCVYFAATSKDDGLKDDTARLPAICGILALLFAAGIV